MEKYKNRILEILKSHDLTIVTPKYIRLKLQEEFQVDLLEFKSELKSLISECLTIVDIDVKEEHTQEQTLEEVIGPDTDVVDSDAKRTKSRKRETRTKVKNTTPKKSAKKESAGKQSSGRKGFQIPHYISVELAEFLNRNTASRAQVTKLVWDYIKENNLQDPKDKRFIVPDEKLKKVLRKDRVQMFKMTKILSDHIKEAAQEEIMETVQDSSQDSETGEPKLKKVKTLKEE